MLPENAPKEYSDRAVLWNAVEKIEKSKNSQLAREIEIALPKKLEPIFTSKVPINRAIFFVRLKAGAMRYFRNALCIAENFNAVWRKNRRFSGAFACEDGFLTKEQNQFLVYEYVNEQFLRHGMCADIAIHDTGGGNPHAHIMLTMRPFEQGGKWGAKHKKDYILDKDGNKIYDPKKRQYKCTEEQTVDWNNLANAEEWRAAWSRSVNAFLEQNNIAEHVDNRSYERQGIEQTPTVHLGVAASQMERKGIRTGRGGYNRNVQNINSEL